MKKTTIKDIAAAVGVSPSAVSAALNNRAVPRLSPETKQRILQAATAMRYKPNYVARSLVSRKSHTLALIVTSILNPYYPELAKGIEDQAYSLGYNVFLCNTDNDPGRNERQIELLLGKGVDGFIVASAVYKDPMLAYLLKEEVPLVLVNRTLEDDEVGQRVDHIVLDNVRGAYIAMDHLYRLGHERIGILAGQMNTSTAVERTVGLKRAQADYGFRFDPGYFIECNFNMEQAYQATMKFISMKHRPTAIFAQNDHMAIAAREAILKSGLKVPEDVALVGFDDIAIASLQGIELTTVSQRKYEMGALAVKILCDKIQGKLPPMTNKIKLDPTLIVRKSCGYGMQQGASPGRSINS